MGEKVKDEILPDHNKDGVDNAWLGPGLVHSA
jgi:hypothetical protein